MAAPRSLPLLHNLGSINLDHVYRVPHLVTPGETLASHGYEVGLGGKGANQSLALARAGGRVCHWGRLGRQDAWARDTLARAGVDVSHLSLDRKSTRLNSSHVRSSYAVFCLQKKSPTRTA